MPNQKTRPDAPGTTPSEQMPVSARVKLERYHSLPGTPAGDGAPNPDPNRRNSAPLPQSEKVAANPALDSDASSDDTAPIPRNASSGRQLIKSNSLLDANEQAAKAEVPEDQQDTAPRPPIPAGRRAPARKRKAAPSLTDQSSLLDRQDRPSVSSARADTNASANIPISFDQDVPLEQQNTTPMVPGGQGAAPEPEPEPEVDSAPPHTRVVSPASDARELRAGMQTEPIARHAPSTAYDPTLAATATMPPTRRKRGMLWLLAAIILPIIALAVIALFVSANPSGGVPPIGSRAPGASNAANATTIAATPGDVTAKNFVVGQNASVIIKAHSSNISVHSGNAGALAITPRQHGGTAAPDPNSVRVLYTQDHDAQGHDRLTVTPDPFFTAVDFVVTIPPTAQVQLTVDSGSLDIHGGQGATVTTGSGSVAVDSIQGPIDINASSGDVDVSDSTGATKISDTNGSIMLTRLNGQTQVTTVNGDVKVSETTLSGDSSLQTQNGSVRFSGSLAAQGTYNLTTFSGDVDLTLPTSSAFTLAASTSSGSVHNAFGNTDVGAAPRSPLTLRTQNGSINIAETS